MEQEQPQSIEMSVEDVIRIGVEARLKQIEEALVAQVGRVVQDGPFKGLVLAPAPHAIPKILGTYEEELWPTIAKAIERMPDVVLNIGCGEGYYAVGLKRRLPGAWVGCYDTSDKCQMECWNTATLNDRDVSVTGAYDGDFFDESGFHRLIVMDCEGAELDYLSEANCANLGNADVIVECHDFLGQPITQILAERLGLTHDIEVIREGGRNTAAISLLLNLGSFDRALAVQEWRPQVMMWVVAWARR
mgnify:CR=1 FL=1|tara:strand:- start:4586 stop:5326 length:741 start_codon:yes stop_codon:yes gene_type:complete